MVGFAYTISTVLDIVICLRYICGEAGSTRFRSLLRNYSKSWNVAGSVTDETIVFLNWPNPCSCIMALGCTQPIRAMSTRNLPPLHHL
jgi:hypothetical protein